MTCNWMTTGCTRLLLALVVSFLFLQTPVCNAAVWQEDNMEVVDEEFYEDGEDEGDEKTDEDEDDEEEFVQNNPWGFDSRKLEAAELFRFRKVFAIEIHKITSVCDLDKKQALKLKIAAKGAVVKEFAVWKKKWNDQMKQFGGMNIDNGNGNKKKKKRKEIVIEDADEIGQEIMQFLNNSNMFGGGVEEARKAIDSDFWRKTVKGVLDSEQFEKYESLLEERKQAHIDAKIDAFVLKMKEELGLTDEQAKQYDALVRPKMEKAPIAPGYYESFVFQYYATKYDKKKMKAVLTEDQYQLMKMVLGPSKSYGAMFDQQAGNAGNAENGMVIEYSVGSLVIEALGATLEEFSDQFGNFVEGMAKAVGAK